jgi:hypothetical protein
MRDTDQLIDQLTDELEPRRRVSPWLGRALVAAIALLTVLTLTAARGMRPDFAAGRPHSVPLIGALIMLCAGAVVAAAVTAMARPAVGSVRGGWQGALAALAVLPAAALVTAAGSSAQRAAMMAGEGYFCLLTGTLASIASIIALTLWLRRGAPTSATRASWLIGIAGGAIGALAMALVCPIDSIMHIGTWHAGIVAVAATGSRLVLPRFLRW